MPSFQPCASALRHPGGDPGIGEDVAHDVHHRLALAARAGEAFDEAADAGGVDEDGGGDGALGVGLGIIETADRRGERAQLGFAEACGQRRARAVAEFLQPLAEAVEQQQEFERASIVGLVKAARNRGDPVDLLESRNAVEVLVQRREKCAERVGHAGAGAGVAAAANFSRSVCLIAARSRQSSNAASSVSAAAVQVTTDIDSSTIWIVCGRSTASICSSNTLKRDADGSSNFAGSP